MRAEPDAIVFVVDDDETVRKSLGSLIRSAGLRVETFASAQEFLAGPRADAPSCLVLDVKLPGLSGLELRRRLTDGRCEIPVIFITAHGNEAARAQALQDGAVEYLFKPFSEEALLDAIRASALMRSGAS
jgi:FixJ family two-component response regulator